MLWYIFFVLKKDHHLCYIWIWWGTLGHYQSYIVTREYRDRECGTVNRWRLTPGVLDVEGPPSLDFSRECLSFGSRVLCFNSVLVLEYVKITTGFRVRQVHLWLNLPNVGTIKHVNRPFVSISQIRRQDRWGAKRKNIPYYENLTCRVLSSYFLLFIS